MVCYEKAAFFKGARLLEQLNVRGGGARKRSAEYTSIGSPPDQFSDEKIQNQESKRGN